MKKKDKPLLLQVLEGLPGAAKFALCEIKFEDEALKIVLLKNVFQKTPVNTYSISLNKLITVDIVTEENIKEKEKSVVGRGIAGATLFGPVGAILGGLSGTGTKKKKTKTSVFVISYYGVNENDVKTIYFSTNYSPIACWDFVKLYRENYAQQQEVNSNGEVIL